MSSPLIRTVFALLLMLAPIGAFAADPAQGLWLTEPDRKAQVAHVKVASCGAALCGTILKAFDKAGTQITTPNVGKRIFWDVVPTGAGTYAGRAWVPQFNKQYNATMTLRGSTLKVAGCLGPVCMSQTWRRVK